MMLKLYQLFLADAPLPDPQSLSQPARTLQNDPLIDHGGQITVYIGAILLVIGIATVVGLFSHRVEHAIVTALGLSTVLIIFFVFINHSTR